MQVTLINQVPYKGMCSLTLCLQMLKFFPSLGEESYNSNKLNKPFLKGVNQKKSCNNSCKSANYIETS